MEQLFYIASMEVETEAWEEAEGRLKDGIHKKG
jgi:hypothetical protein|nr:MAG TPA: hypothetical protein [Caudoviricetes sp.]DAQ75507.1 MAG TPA: hypothetical protein [Caudoviricetes sp.]